MVDWTMTTPVPWNTTHLFASRWSFSLAVAPGFGRTRPTRW